MSFHEVTIGPCRLILGDCLEVLPTLAPGSVDAVVTDPPYGIPVSAAFVRKNCERIDDGSGVFNEHYSWDWLTDPNWLVAGGNVAAFHRRGDSLPSHIIAWHRFYLVKDAPPPTPRPVFVSAIEECSIGRKVGRSRWFGTGYEINYWRGLTPNRLNNSEHPSEKPLDAIETLVRCLSDDAETVIDPFMGSGTTGVACVNLERRFIGIEKEPKYFDIACKRIQRAWDLKCSELPFDKPEPARQLELV